MNKEEVYSHLRFLGWRIETDEVGDKYAIRLEQELEAGHLICLSMVFHRLCCINRVRDSSRESSVVAGMHEQTDAPDLQDQELASLQ